MVSDSQSPIVVIHCRCSPINFLSKMSITLTENSSFPLRFMFLIIQFTTGEINLINNFITCFKNSYVWNWSIQEAFSDFKDTKTYSLYLSQFKLKKKKSSFCLYLAVSIFIAIVFSLLKPRILDLSQIIFSNS